MKTPSRFHAIPTACLLAMLGGILLLASCASMDASNQRTLLAAAGFRVRTPETARQKELYASSESYKVLRASLEGKVFYAYKDEKNGVAYVGGEPEYQRYQELAVQKQIARDNYEAAEMQRDTAFGWYGAWGPAFMGPGYIGPGYVRPVVLRPGYAGVRHVHR